MAFNEIFAMIRKLSRKVDRMIEYGVVTAYDPATETVMVKRDEGGDPVEAEWAFPMAGNFKFRITPSVGQAVELRRRGGDARQLTASNSPFTGKNKSPSSHPDELMIERGSTRLIMRDNHLEMHVGESQSIILTPDKILLNGNFEHEGGYFKSHGVPVDHTHKHDKVAPGNAISGTPVS
ncbi:MULTISPECIES: hypothetical protein [unclassified Pseudovibrio]|uniref:hypothetical protein n=1 Tax=unclassified Pseudovibrio TaxID=2627060 RepID=UPI0007AE8EC2|nr:MULTISPECIES: hypothetical protein [unclassified Pseudovibrio]KZL02268.1 Phage-related baseplate assembly protein [Pseudovibrio sp. W74]KZL08188.1 Phage-related baseplate assembly protein [Pseudovibrio sp. Ad14]